MKASSGQKFCRACGFGLDKVAQLIAEQAAEAEGRTNEADADLTDDRLRKIEKWSVRALLAIASSLGGLMLWGIIYKLMIEKGKVFPGVVILMVVAAIGLIALLGYLESQKKKPVSARSNQQLHLAPAEETARMLSEPKIEISSSVTEQTTASLEEKLESRR
jgi:hypothetical protein